MRPFVKRWIGLTGIPTSNSLMDLLTEIGFLDGDQRLGCYCLQQWDNQSRHSRKSFSSYLWKRNEYYQLYTINRERSCYVMLAPFPITGLHRLYNTGKELGEGEMLRALKCMVGMKFENYH